MLCCGVGCAAPAGADEVAVAAAEAARAAGGGAARAPGRRVAVHPARVPARRAGGHAPRLRHRAQEDRRHQHEVRPPLTLPLTLNISLLRGRG